MDIRWGAWDSPVDSSRLRLSVIAIGEVSSFFAVVRRDRGSVSEKTKTVSSSLIRVSRK